MKKAYLISDKEFLSDTWAQLNGQTRAFLSARGFEIEEKQIDKGELAYCKGCFGCWIRKPGECVIGDYMADINRSFMQSDAVIVLSPVVFGQFSANIKNAIDRWLPNMLPFFTVRKDGSTMHPPRYKSYPKQVFIGYGDSLLDEDAALFCDITDKHRSNVTTLVFRGGDISPELEKINLSRVRGVL